MTMFRALSVLTPALLGLVTPLDPGGGPPSPGRTFSVEMLDSGRQEPRGQPPAAFVAQRADRPARGGRAGRSGQRERPLRLRVLIDSSGDGGTWWFPQDQGGPFDPDQPHQGWGLAQHLRDRGCTVRELPADMQDISPELKDADLIIRVGDFQPQTEKEVKAYLDHVERGGALLLVANYRSNPRRPGGDSDPLADALGIHFERIVQGGVIGSWAEHPITRGLPKMPFRTSSVVTRWPPSATPLGRFDKENGHAVVMGAMTRGKGRVLFFSSLLTLEAVPQPLTDRMLNWLASPDSK